MSQLSRFIAKGSNKANVATPSPTRYGTVVSVSGQQASVMVDGNTEATPCTAAVGCRVGQRVVVEVSNGIALVTGNVTAPSPDGTTIDELIGETLIRETSDGILVAKVGNEYGALVNSEGSFDVVRLYWADEQPSILGRVVRISKNLQRFTVDADGGVFLIDSENADGQPVFRYSNGGFLAGFMAGRTLSFSPLSQTEILTIQSGQLNPTTDFSVEADGGMLTKAFSMPATNSTVADIVTAPTPSSPSDPTITISSCSAVVWGKLCQLDITWSSDKDIGVSADGNVTNVTVGTIDSGYRPLIEAVGHANGDNLGAEIYHVYASGNVALSAMEGTGAARTIAANSSHTFRALYIIK